MSTGVALVTGAAGGIGAAVVRALTERRTSVAALDRSGERVRSVAAALDTDGCPVRPFVADVTSEEEVGAAVARIERELGPIHQLVTAAGVLHVADVVGTSSEAWNQMFAVNATGVFTVTRAVVQRMIPRRRGAIVTVASNAAAVPRSHMAGYAASKAAATMFTKSLGLELARYGIRCNTVAPGSTDTAMLRSMWTDDSGPPRTIAGDPAAFRVGIPLGRLAAPEQVAEAVAFLLSDRAAHITLHDLTVDGGAALGA